MCLCLICSGVRPLCISHCRIPKLCCIKPELCRLIWFVFHVHIVWFCLNWFVMCIWIYDLYLVLSLSWFCTSLVCGMLLHLVCALVWTCYIWSQPELIFGLILIITWPLRHVQCHVVHVLGSCTFWLNFEFMPLWALNISYWSLCISVSLVHVRYPWCLFEKWKEKKNINWCNVEFKYFYFCSFNLFLLLFAAFDCLVKQTVVWMKAGTRRYKCYIRASEEKNV